MSAVMHSAARAHPIAPHILEEAADFLMQLHAGAVTDDDRAACERWRRRSPEHARAWSRAELLMNKLGGLPPTLAKPVLQRPTDTRRRAAVMKLAALLAVLPGGWLAWRSDQYQAWTADHRTAVGERRRLQLADGSRLVLNTATAIDVGFDASNRLVRLRAGEILVRTAPDTSAVHRPFRIATAEGELEALGTYFSVRQENGRTHIAVLESAVRISPAKAQESEQVVLQAGQQTTFTRRNISPASPVDDGAIAWSEGMLLADKMRLADFATELARYRQGVVSCDPAIADIRVSGAFPISDTERALGMLTSTYPVETRSRLSGYWITLVAR